MIAPGNRLKNGPLMSGHDWKRRMLPRQPLFLRFSSCATDGPALRCPWLGNAPLWTLVSPVISKARVALGLLASASFGLNVVCPCIYRLRAIGRQSVSFPEGFHVHPRLKRMHCDVRLKRLGDSVSDTDNQIDWAAAEGTLQGVCCCWFFVCCFLRCVKKCAKCTF